jgi:hexosaminidase
MQLPGSPAGAGSPPHLYSGEWRRQTGLVSAHAGTAAASDSKGASFTVHFTGRKFTWFTKQGERSGKAQVLVDGRPDAVVDTYTADEIWGVGIYTKEFSAAGPHTVTISVLGEPGGPPGYSLGADVYLDGIRIERE